MDLGSGITCNSSEMVKERIGGLWVMTKVYLYFKIFRMCSFVRVSVCPSCT